MGRRRRLSKRWKLVAVGVPAVFAASFAAFALTSSSTTASSPLVCPNDDKIGGHGVPNPASPPEHAAPDDAVRDGLQALAGLETPAVQATSDPSLFLVKATDGQTVIATARVVPEGDGWRLDQWEMCGYPTHIPDPGPGRIVPPPTTTSTEPGAEPTGSTGRARA